MNIEQAAQSAGDLTETRRGWRDMAHFRRNSVLCIRSRPLRVRERIRRRCTAGFGRCLFVSRLRLFSYRLKPAVQHAVGAVRRGLVGERLPALGRSWRSGLPKVLVDRMGGLGYSMLKRLGNKGNATRAEPTAQKLAP
jgi:hypothetical protein